MYTYYHYSTQAVIIAFLYSSEQIASVTIYNAYGVNEYSFYYTNHRNEVLLYTFFFKAYSFEITETISVEFYVRVLY